MITARRWKVVSALAAALALSLAASACGGGHAAPQASSDPHAPVELTVATFNEFGYEDLFTAYMAEHPYVTIKHKKAATSDEARDNLTTRLAAGSGLSDVEAIEVDWLPELILNAVKFTDLSDPAVDGRWLDRKAKAAADAGGRLIGYGSDIGPEAICYRSDLFKRAGLPTDRAEVATLLGAVFPLWWSIVVGSSDKTAVNSPNPPLLPGGNLWRNAATVIDTVPFWKAFGNSMIVPTSVALSVVFFSTLAGFASAKLHFGGQNGLLVFVFATMAVRPQLGVIPLFIVVSRIQQTLGVEAGV